MKITICTFDEFLQSDERPEVDYPTLEEIAEESGMTVEEYLEWWEQESARIEATF